MTSPEEEIIDLIEDPFSFFDMQVEAFKAIMAKAYEAGFSRGFDVGRVEVEEAPSFEEWWGGEDLSE